MTPSEDPVHEAAERDEVEPIDAGDAEAPVAPAPRRAAPPPAEAAREPWLTAEWSDAFGPAGHFKDLTAEEAAGAPDGVLVKPTAEQLAQRLRR